MQRFKYKDMLVSIGDLIELSGGLMKANSIKAYCNRSSSTPRPKSWINNPDPHDGRKILIHYSSIPAQTVKKYSLPTVAELIAKIRHERDLDKVYGKQQEIDFNLDRLDKLLKQAVEENFTKYSPMYSKLVQAKTDAKRRALVLELARTHAVLVMCAYAKGEYKVADIHAAYLKVEGIKKTLNNPLKFGTRLNDCKNPNFSVAHGSAFKPREYIVKMSAWHTAKVALFYSHPNQYTAKIIHRLLCAECDKYGKQQVSISSVEKLTSSKKFKNIYSVLRNQEYYEKYVQPTTRRIDPHYPGDLYYADGSPVQIHYVEESGKRKTLSLFVVMDVMSKKIVGFDLSPTEDRYNWLNAIKMALTRERVAPVEMLHDNASATKTEEFIRLRDMLGEYGCNFLPTTAGSPTQKADVERFYETFQSGYQRQIDGFFGEGIRSKRANGRIDAGYLAHHDKHGDLYTQDKLTEIVTDLICMYNADIVKKTGKTPNEAFAADKPHAIKLDETQLALMFWNCRKLKIGRSEVKITIKKHEYFFEVFEHDTALAVDNSEVLVYYDEQDMTAVHLFSLTGNYVTTCRAKKLIQKAKISQQTGDVEQIIKQTAHHTSKRNFALKAADSLIQAGIEGNEESFLITANPFDNAKKDLRNDAESEAMRRYVQQATGIAFKDDYTPTPLPGSNASKNKYSKKNQVKATLQPIHRP